jgi:hypothetical protein
MATGSRMTSNPDAPDPLFDHVPKDLKLPNDGPSFKPSLARLAFPQAMLHEHHP